MSPRTPTHPPNDAGMWRRMVARCHPDSGGSHELFIWSMATRDVVIGGELGSEIPRYEKRSSGSTVSTDRVSYVDAFGSGTESTGALLDWCPVGVIVSLSGQKTVVAWDALRSVTLMND